MRFGRVPTPEAVGAISAHALKAPGVLVKKGSRISPEAATGLESAGIASVVAVRLDDGDVGEDEAAMALARAVGGQGVRVEPPFTGRANLFAEAAGVLLIDRRAIDAVNRVDEAVTVATLPAFRAVVEGEMLATVKIIPYAVGQAVLEASLEALAPAAPVRLAPYRLRRVGVISTTTLALKPTVIGKTVTALARRLEPASAAIVAEAVCAHETDALHEALARQVAGRAELIVIFGASAIADRRDVIPAAIERAGGAVEHFGMPVDPGNLLLMGRIAGKPVIGAPGCARSPKENGFDWVLQRLLAALAVTRADITAMGVGGLLMEIVSRGQPRAGGEPDDEA